MYRPTTIETATRQAFLGDVSTGLWPLRTFEAPLKCGSGGPGERGLVVVGVERTEAQCLAFARQFISGNSAEIHVMKPSSADPAGEVRDMAIALEADWLCMVTHARPGVMSLFLTSNDERMLRAAPCPVVCVPDSLRPGRKVEPAVPGSRPIQRILVPINSPGNRHVLTHAVRLADRFGAKIDLLGVEESIHKRSDVSALNFSRLKKSRQQVASDEMAALADKVVPKHQRGRESVSLGFPTFYATTRAMRDFETDLIVLAVPSRLWQAHARIDVGTERILHEASCPVICFHEPEDNSGADTHPDQPIRERSPEILTASRQ